MICLSAVLEDIISVAVLPKGLDRTLAIPILETVIQFCIRFLLDNHLSVVGLKQITAPVDILNQSDLEKELDELGSLRSKADAIGSIYYIFVIHIYKNVDYIYESLAKINKVCFSMGKAIIFEKIA